jgi:hypothetical protein
VDALVESNSMKRCANTPAVSPCPAPDQAMTKLPAPSVATHGVKRPPVVNVFARSGSPSATPDASNRWVMML